MGQYELWKELVLMMGRVGGVDRELLFRSSSRVVKNCGAKN